MLKPKENFPPFPNGADSCEKPGYVFSGLSLYERITIALLLAFTNSTLSPRLISSTKGLKPAVSVSWTPFLVAFSFVFTAGGMATAPVVEFSLLAAAFEEGISVSSMPAAPGVSEVGEGLLFQARSMSPATIMMSTIAQIHIVLFLLSILD